MPREKPKRVIGEDGELVIDAPDTRKRKPKSDRRPWIDRGAAIGLALVVIAFLIIQQRGSDPDESTVYIPTAPSSITGTPIPDYIRQQFADCDSLIAEANPADLRPLNMWGDMPGLFLFDEAAGRACMPELPPGQATYYDPVLSPDRQKLFYLRYVQLSQKVDLYVANANGTEARTIATGIRRQSTSSPPLIWSPDGRELLFIADDVPERAQSTATTLNTVSADGTQSRLIARIRGQTTMPVWSPDGTRLAFLSNTFSDEGTPGWTVPIIHVVDAETGEITDIGAWISTSSGYQMPRPEWAADGQSLIFNDEFTDPAHRVYSVE